MGETLAVKYRPKKFDDVVEQSSTKTILLNQLQNHSIKNAYLFCGGAGTGKTTCARIFASEINEGKGIPIELDAASHSSVDDVRGIIEQAQTKSLYSEYKVFIIDECHSLSGTAWQAFLKLLEEPPAKSIFIFCTTNPEKIPATILSRVQRYNFHRISQEGIHDRLMYIYQTECLENKWQLSQSYVSAFDYIAKIANGGMRDAITLLDKCLSYSTDLTIENVLKAIGNADYVTMMNLTDAIVHTDNKEIINIIEDVNADGIDLKQFIKQFLNFVLDVSKYSLAGIEFTNLPNTEGLVTWLNKKSEEFDKILTLLDILVNLNSEIKYDDNPKYMIEATLLTRRIE